jgi:GAF domain-containing protein
MPLLSWSGCHSAVEYTARTLETIVLENAYTNQQYRFVALHPYVQQHRLKSLLVLPITRNNELKAILYLENNLIEGCFTSDRITPLNTLTGQMAISLENSKFFETQLRAAKELADVEKKRAQDAEEYRQQQEEFIDRICHEVCYNSKH